MKKILLLSVLLAACAGPSSTEPGSQEISSDFLGSCYEPDLEQCSNVWSTEMTVSQARAQCDSINGNYSDGNCPCDNLTGICNGSPVIRGKRLILQGIAYSDDTQRLQSYCRSPGMNGTWSTNVNICGIRPEL